MDKRISVCEKDTYYLEKLTAEGLVQSISQPMSYQNRVVLKPWGYEFAVFENDKVAIWFLYIKEGHSTSMHCHPQKATTLAVMKGEVFFTTFLERRNLKTMEAVVIDKAVFHSTTSVSPGGIFLLELETPPNKTDLVRFNDSYGRVKEGYEPTSQMAETGLDKYGYFHFIEEEGETRHATPDFQASLHMFATTDELKKFELKDGEKALICRGSLCWGDHLRAEVGEIFDRDHGGGKTAWIPAPLTLFRIAKGSP